MFSIDPAGLLLEGNGSYFAMTGHSREKVFAMSWMEIIHEDSLPEAIRGWKLLTEDKVIWSAELVGLGPNLICLTRQNHKLKTPS